ncbi:hypothetical protein SDC9_86616 [bioreactor metagenome]|uniref:Uncharacterized protein n=1 Tax=bioreactor metagenome TaxID=1076179 RepID=A0A644ZGQ1_9ZZZZ
MQPVFFRACGDVAVAKYVQRADRVRRLRVDVDEVAAFAAKHVDRGQAVRIRFHPSGYGERIVACVAVNLDVRRGTRGNGYRIPAAAAMHGYD